MLILASHLKNLPIVSSLTQEMLGRSENIVVNPDDGRVIGILLNTLGFFPRTKVISPVDIVDFAPDAIMVSGSENIVDIGEIMRVKEVLGKKYKILDQRAKTKSGKNLGKVYDILIETNVWTVVKYYIRNLLNERILPQEKIEEITPKAIIFKDDVETGEIVAEEAPEAA